MGEFSLEVDQSHSQETPKIFFCGYPPKGTLLSIIFGALSVSEGTVTLLWRVSERVCLSF